MIKNKNILITGGNSGIGFFAIVNLLKTKNILYVVIKNEFRKNEFLRKIEKHFDKNYLSKFTIAKKPIPELPPVIKIFLFSII